MSFGVLVLVCNLQIFNFNFVFSIYISNCLYWVVICMKFYFTF